MRRNKTTRPVKTQGVFMESLRFFWTYPISIVPLVIAWCIYAAVILYLRFFLNWDSLSVPLTIVLVISCYVLFSLVYGIASLILLEIAQQIETTGVLKLGKAVSAALSKDFLKALPILLVWAFIWFSLAFLDVLFSSKEKKKQNEGYSACAAVGTMLGDDNDASSFFSALSKGVRMLAFMILPAVAWEDLPPVAAFKRGIKVLTLAEVQFAKAYISTGVFSFAVMIIPSLIFYFDSKQSLNLPDLFWYFVLVYIAFASSLVFMVEQLYVAQIYLWYMAFEKKYPYLRKSKPLECAEEPSFFDDVKTLSKK